MKPEPNSYAYAVATPSWSVWPGCGDGRCRPCGNVHDFSYSTSGGLIYHHRFHCLRHWNGGCPEPKPEPVHDLARNGYCRVCHRRIRKTERTT